jgi:hypothetical protein
MARYNSVNSTGSIAGGNTISTPASGLLTTLTGTGTVTLPNPVLYTGSTQTFYNSTGAAITLSTPSGNFTGPGTGGTTTLSLLAGSILTVVSDGTNYIAQDWLGGPISTNGTATFNGTIAANPTNLSVSIQPTGTGVLTLSSGTTGSLDNVNVGATTQGTGKFSTLTATGTISTTASTAATLGTGGTGALQSSGGASIAGILNVGGATYHAGNVSVGTSSTSYKLTVQGDTNAIAAQILPQGALPDNNDNAGLYVLHQGTAGTGLRVRTDNALTGTIFAHVLVNNASAGINGFQVSQFGTGFIADFNKGGVAANSVRINNSGNMGIGTTSPGATLDMGSRTDAIILPVGTTAQRPTGVNGMMRKNSSNGYVEYWDPASSSWLGIGAFSASGGDTVSTYTSGSNYKYHQFTNSGSFQVLAGAKSIEYMIIGGGGGGGTLGGGGGAGGYVTGTFTASVGTYSIVIGAGANGGAPGTPGGTGTNTTALGLTAYGGGGGGSHTGGPTSVAGTNGGSGGGSGDNAGSYPYGTGTAGQGNRGGNGSSVYSNNPRGGGGGGGAGGVGFDNTVPSNAAGGAGGPGLLNDMNGSSYYWAGGGGYSGYSAGARGGDCGIGGGGGGSCADTASPAGAGGGSALNSGTAGTAGNNTIGGLGGQNTGGGGGGNGWSYNGTGGRSGGSGIVIIRYTV